MAQTKSKNSVEIPNIRNLNVAENEPIVKIVFYMYICEKVKNLHIRKYIANT